MSKMQTANIYWHTDQSGHHVPISEDFDDVYFSKAGGFDETRYVFLGGNRLSDRFKTLTTHQTFVIIETGFGTGLNFLATCLLWSKLAPPTARLHFVSTEKFPLTPSDLKTALSVWQDDDTYAFINGLIDNYPLALAGCHRLHFGNITLDLWLGDAKDSFHQMAGQIADAWFLDGFAPTKNSELWLPEIFDHIHRLSKPNATLATFTSAGFVKRELLRIGMTVQKIKGFGRKREMLTAFFDKTDNRTTSPKTAIIIGAGVSGLLSAYALARRGIDVIITDKTAPLAGASGNPRALLAPKLTTLENASEHLPTVSFLYAERLYRQFNEKSDTQIFNQTGAIDFLLPTQKPYDKLASLVNSYPDELIYIYDDRDSPDFRQHTISTCVPTAGLVNPKHLAKHILSHPNIHFHQHHATAIIEYRDTVMVQSNDDVLTADMVVICAGFESHLLHNKLFNPRKIRGQISYTDEITHPDLNITIKYDGYCASFDHRLLMGASFVRNCTDTAVNDSEHDFNLQKFAQALPSLAKTLNLTPKDLHGRASIRAQTPDYHPIVGHIHDSQRIFSLYGMGSKGFSFAPLCAEILAGLIFDEPLPISRSLLNKLSPKRQRLQTPLDQNQ